MNKDKYRIIALIGESGSGKDHLLKALTNSHPEYNKIINYTSRPQRDKEINGINYHFVTEDQFLDMIENNRMLEWTSFNRWYYGTSLSSLDKNLVNIGVFNLEGIYSLIHKKEVELKIFKLRTSDKTRLLRQLNRENDPDIEEIIRRFRADKIDFQELDFPYIEIENETTKDFENCLQQIRF